jgi:hypothetical protein
VQFCFGVAEVSLALPSGDCVEEGLLVWNAAVEALGGRNAEFGFGQIGPTSVLGRIMAVAPLDQPPGLGGRERLERSLAMNVEIILDEDDRLGILEMAIGQVFQGMGVVDGGVAVGEQSRSMGMSTQPLSGIAAR